MEELSIAAQAGVPVLLWGPPGSGKTSHVRALGEALGVRVEVVIASIREPADFSGLPVIREYGVEFAPPSWARRLAEDGGILFLDEISTAPPAVQAALLRVVLDRVVGDLPLPEDVAVVAAANPPEQAAGGWDLTPPLANRFCHLSWKADVGTWADGMLRGWPRPAVPALPDGWTAYIPEQAAVVAAFVKARPHLLLQVPKDESLGGKAWPSPRTWELAARLLAAARSVNASEDVEAGLVGGCVGDGAGLEFLGWHRALDLPDPEDVLRGPDGFVLPQRGDQAYAVLASVVSAALRHLTTPRWLAAWIVLARAADQGGADVAAWAAKALAGARKPGLPLPKEEALRFTPLLKAAGLL